MSTWPTGHPSDDLSEKIYRVLRDYEEGKLRFSKVYARGCLSPALTEVLERIESAIRNEYTPKPLEGEALMRAMQQPLRGGK